MAEIYPICDLDALEAAGLGLQTAAEVLLGERPPWLQVRAKGRTDAEVLAALEVVVQTRGALRGCTTLVLANDRPDLALFAGCDGVHVGQADTPVSDVRRFASQLHVGVSTHDLSQLEEALAAAPDYVAVGPVFMTTTKKDAEPAVGLAGVAAAQALCRPARMPLVAIGGIGAGTLAAVGQHCDAVALISGLFSPSVGFRDGAKTDAERRAALRERYRQLLAVLRGAC